MRIAAVAGIFIASAALAQDMGTPPKVVPMFTLMASVITTPSPRLPEAFKAAHPEGTFKATYEVCVDTSGAVNAVTTIVSIGDIATDAALADQMKRTWQYKPQPQPVCFRKPFLFDVRPGATTTPEQVAKIHQLSDAFVRDLIRGDVHAAYGKLSPVTRARLDERQLSLMLTRTEKTSGKLLSADFAMQSSRKERIDATREATLWIDRYSLGTSTAPKGAQALDVAVLLDPEPAVYRFQIVRAMGQP